MAFGVEEAEEYSEDHLWEGEDPMEDESLEALAAEDDDASMVLQFENALMHGHRARRPGTRHFLCELPRCPSALVGEVSLTWVLAGQNLQRKWKGKGK